MPTQNFVKLHKKMKIGFVCPCDMHNFKPFRNPPLNALYFLTILEKTFGESADVSLIDLRGVNKEHAIYYVPEKDIYFHSVATIDYPEIVRIVQEMRNIYPKAVHIAGGVHINIFPKESLKIFDSIVLGEGENLIIEIVKDVSESRLKKIYQEDKILDINAYPYPSKKYTPKSAVAEIGILGGVYYNMLGTAVLLSRGCPFKCHFCANPVQSAGRYRLPELIIEEIEYLKNEYGIQCASIKDDNIISANVEISKKTLLALKKTGIKWRGNCRANGISRDIIKLAKEAGCVDLAIGVESVSQQVLHNINKRLDLEKAKEFMSILNEEKIGIRLNLIIGLPGEPKDIVQQSIEFVKNVKPSSVLLCVLTPIPGSEMYKNPQKFGMKMDPNITFDKLFNVFSRFDESEKPYMVFEYDKVTPFGEGKSSAEIIDNYQEIQTFLRENKLTF